MRASLQKRMRDRILPGLLSANEMVSCHESEENLRVDSRFVVVVCKIRGLKLVRTVRRTMHRWSEMLQESGEWEEGCGCDQIFCEC